MIESSGIFERKILFIKSIVLMLFLLSACSMVGSIVPVTQQLPLSTAAVKEGVYESGDLRVEYKYVVRGDVLEISGSTYKPGGMDSFDLLLFFLDSDGKVLQQKLLCSVGYRKHVWRSDDLSFQKSLPVPPNTAGISFGYSGTPQRGRK